MTTKSHTDGNGYYDLEPMDPEEDESNDWIACNGFGGTSAAAPMVAGVLAAIMGQNGEVDGEDAQEIALRTAEDVLQYGIGWDTRSGWGRPNLLDALEWVSVPKVVERGTAFEWTPHVDGSGVALFMGVPGLEDEWYSFVRYRIEQTEEFRHDFSETPYAWPRVLGTVGWRAVPDFGEFHYADEDAGWAEVVDVTSSTITLATYIYDISDFETQEYLGVFPSDSPSMSYTAIGDDPTSSVTAESHGERKRTLWPNPANEAVWIRSPSSGASDPGRVDVFNAAGRLVSSLGATADGLFEWNLRDGDGRRVASGPYFVRIPGLKGATVTRLLVVR